jgi:hypothetical protein
MALAAGFVAGAYFILTLDRQRANSPSKDDTQVGIKLVLFGLLIAGISLAAGGLHGLLAYALGGFKGGSGPIKGALPPILVGAGVAAAVALALLPRTNQATYRQAERFALGLLGVFFGIQMIDSINQVLTNLFTSQPWAATSNPLAGFLVAAVISLVAIFRLGAHSGWTAPVRPQQSYMPPGGGGGGYPPQQGYGQQQGGYPPQGGGYPPQGGGYPPQGGGYPPQGGGYPGA